MEVPDARELARKRTTANPQRASKAANEAPYSAKTTNSERVTQTNGEGVTASDDGKSDVGCAPAT